MSKTIQERLHAQHRRWESDLAAWRFDGGEWRRELRAASVALDEIREFLQGALDALEAHTDAVWEQEQRIHAHELTLLREYQEGARKKTDKQWAAAHHRLAREHERVAAAHERIKKDAHRVIARIRRLVEQARAAM